MSEHKKTERDIEKGYTAKQFAEKLRRLVDCLDEGNKFQIQELEFQLKWEN